MFINYFNGFCPELLLTGKEIKLKLNEDDFWECSETGLIIGTFPTHATIYSWRGKGKFRKNQQDPVDFLGLPYCNEPDDLTKHYKMGKLIENEIEFILYLQSIKTKVE